MMWIIMGALLMIIFLAVAIDANSRIEDTLNEILGLDDDGGLKAAVTAVPDPRKGERLVVLHTPLSRSPEDLCKALAEFLFALAIGSIALLIVANVASIVALVMMSSSANPSAI